MSAALLRPFLEQQWSSRRRRRRSRPADGLANCDHHVRYDRTSIYQHDNHLSLYSDDDRGVFGIGGTGPRPRSTRQIIGRSHRRRPSVLSYFTKTSVGLPILPPSITIMLSLILRPSTSAANKNNMKRKWEI